MEALYTIGGVAARLGVNRATAANWLTRYNDLPVPDYTLNTGKRAISVWTRASLALWEQWYNRAPNRAAGL